jgi:hypothetical protein
MGNARALTMLLAGLCCALAGSAWSQPAGLNVGRDCQTIRTCNFARRGTYRGCLSTYSCRVCRFMRAACYIDGARRVCQQMRCTWG